MDSKYKLTIGEAVTIATSILVAAFLVAAMVYGGSSREASPVEQAARATADEALAREFDSEYVKNLIALQGSTYEQMNCSTFISIAHFETRAISSLEIANGANGRMRQVGGEYADAVILSVNEDSLRPGDVAVFLGGGHVAAYLGNHTWTDSTHRGVTSFRMAERAPFDYWYNGVSRGGMKTPIKVFRFVK